MLTTCEKAVKIQ